MSVCEKVIANKTEENKELAMRKRADMLRHIYSPEEIDARLSFLRADDIAAASVPGECAYLRMARIEAALDGIIEARTASLQSDRLYLHRLKALRQGRGFGKPGVVGRPIRKGHTLNPSGQTRRWYLERYGIEYDGERLLPKEWADRLGITTRQLSSRIAQWGVERALTTPKLTHTSDDPILLTSTSPSLPRPASPAPATIEQQEAPDQPFTRAIAV